MFDSSTSSIRFCSVKKGVGILLLILFCCGFTLQHKAVCRTKTHKSIPEIYSDAVKEFTIQQDTVATILCLGAILKQDSTHAPALNLLSRITRNTNNAVKYSERAYLSDTTNHHYLHSYGSALIQAGEHRRAIPIFEKIVRKSTEPNDFRILAVLLNGDHKPERAISVLDSADMRFGRIPTLGRIRQFLLLKLGRILEAEADAKKQVEEAPYLAENHCSLGDIYAQTHRDSLALVSFQNAIKIDTLALEPWLMLSEYYKNKGDNSSYLSLLPRIFANSQLPLADKIEEWKLLTNDQNSYRKFYLKYDSIIKQLYILNPENKEVAQLYIEHLFASGETETALQLCKQLLRKESATIDDFRNVVAVEDLLNRPDSVSRYLNLALERFPESIELLLTRGFLASRRNDFDSAIADCHEAISHTKEKLKQADIYSSIAYFEYKRNNIKGCYKAFNKALKNSAKNDTLRGRILSSLGDIEHERKEIKRGFKAYEKSLRCFYDNPNVLNNYAYNLSLEELDLERALSMINRALELSETSAIYLDTKAWVLYKLGRYAEAKKIMQQALSLDREKEYTFALHYGDILHALGEDFMAKTYWRKALELGADKEEIEKRFLPKTESPKKE